MGLIGATVVVAVVAFVLLRSGNDDDKSSDSEPAATTTATDGKTVAAPKPKLRVERIVLEGGEPVGGEKKLKFTKGDTVRIDVVSDTPSEIHVHGYDIKRQAAPAKPARFRFDAKLDGGFEMEAHFQGDKKIATLEIQPG